MWYGKVSDARDQEFKGRLLDGEWWEGTGKLSNNGKVLFEG